jgi:hypothetical protein
VASGIEGPEPRSFDKILQASLPIEGNFEIFRCVRPE